MKFSVLLPTRDRLEYLTYAIETVRRQDQSDWEIIVSDNCSKDDIAGYVRSLNDARIKYFRMESAVPVTDNWNNALEKSSGDYVVMLGDDDGLLPGYFSAILEALVQFPDPDFVYSSAYFYAYPGVMPDAPAGFLKRDRNSAFGERQPFWLEEKRACAVAKGYLDFRMPVASNMQFSLISRRKISELSGAGRFFQSPYPDFYATPTLFLTSSRILVYPEPLVIVGITPKSYGYFHFNSRTSDGVKFLENTRSLEEKSGIEALRLPGTSYYDSWLLAMEALRRNHSQSRGMQPNYRRYRFLQIIHGYKKHYLDRSADSGHLRLLRSRMRVAERMVYGLALPVVFGAIGFMPVGLRQRIIRRLRAVIGQHAISRAPSSGGGHANLLDVFESMKSQV